MRFFISLVALCVVHAGSSQEVVPTKPDLFSQGESQICLSLDPALLPLEAAAGVENLSRISPGEDVLLFAGNNPVDTESIKDMEDGGLELPLLKEEKPKKTSRKKKKKTSTRYPYDLFDLDLGFQWGHDDNVFRSADIFIPETPEAIRPQADDFTRTEIDFEWDHYFSRDDKLSLDYTYTVGSYDELELADEERHLARLEWRHRLRPKEYVTLGLRESRLLQTSTNRFGEPLDSDPDYFRTDLYWKYELDVIQDHQVEFEYRFVHWNYDEISDPEKRSDDWREHRLRAEVEREFGPNTEGSIWMEGRWRDYREELARNSGGDRIESEGRSARRTLLGVRVEHPLGDSVDLGLEVEYDQLTDPFENYYSYNGFNYRVDFEWRFCQRWTLEGDARLYDRDYDKRLFLASHVPNPEGRPKFLDPPYDLYESYRVRMLLKYACTENLEFFGGWIHRWHHVNDPTEEYRENQFYLGLTYSFRWKRS